MKKLYSLILSVLFVSLSQHAWAADPDLSGYTKIKTMDFTTATYPSVTNITLATTTPGTAYETGNKAQQNVYDVTTPADLSGYLAFQGVVGGSLTKGWTIRSTYGGLYSVGGPRSGLVLGLKKDYVVAFTCNQTASNVITLTNKEGTPDGNFTYELSADAKTYFATMTADGNVGFCGAKSVGYISSITIYAPGSVVVKPTGIYKSVNGKSRTVTFTGTNLAYNTDGSKNYTNFKDGDGKNVNTVDVTVSDSTKYYVVSTNATDTSEVLAFNIAAGTELSLATPLVSISTMSDGYTKAYLVTCDNTNVLLTPTATLTYDFIPLGASVPTEKGVVFNGTINATTAGTYNVTASSEGYKSTTATIDNTVKYVLSKTFDFTKLTAADLSANWKLKTSAGPLPGSSSQWPNTYGSVIADEYYYDFNSATASSTDIIPGLNVEFTTTGKTPKLYTGFGFMYPVYQLNADGSDAATAITGGNISIANGQSNQYGVYTYINNYGKNGVKTAIVSGDKAYNLYRFSDILTKVDIYSPKVIVIDTATINFNDSASAVSTSTSTAGDIISNKIITAKNLTLTITPKTAASTTANRFWTSSGKVQLRVYSGKLLFDVPTGMSLRSITISAGTYNSGNTINGTSTTTWTGNSTNAILNIAGSSQINKIVAIYQDADAATTTYTEPAPPLPVAANIAALKAMVTKTNAKLMLNGAKVTYVNGDNIYIEDNTGSILLYKTGLQITAGKSITGFINGQYILYSGTPELSVCDSTSISSFTEESATVTPTSMVLTDIKNAAAISKFVTINSAKIDSINGVPYLIQNTDTVIIYDKYSVLNTSYIMPKNVQSITAIVGFFNNVYQLYPISSDSIVEVKIPTGISEKTTNLQNGDVYSINGLIIQKSNQPLKNLKKGIYIMNGKKFVVK